MKKNSGKMTSCILTTVFLIAIIFIFGKVNVSANVKEINKKMIIGQRYQIKTDIKNDVHYKSYDTSIAYVNSEGIVTAKKTGDVKIKVGGTNGKKIIINVHVDNTRKNKKPVIPLTFDEIKKKSVSIEKKAENDYVYTANIKNNSKKYTVKKVIYTYTIQTKDIATDAAVKAKDVKLTFKNVKPGKESKNASCQAGYTGLYKNMKLKSVELYSGNAIYIYNALKNKYTLKWGVPDKKAPVFSGWIKGNSVCHSQIYKTYYSDRKKTYKFTDHIEAEDDRDGPVSIKADTSGINWNKTGVYKIKYTAVDKAGNKASTWAKAQVFATSTPERIADQVLASITKKGWSDERKARAIYKYVRKNCSYVNHTKHTNWRSAAVTGLRYSSGDCYTYYAISRLLLTRAGIMNFGIKRYPTSIGRHYWNLVYVRGGWYHFDTTPRASGGVFCLVTDSQLKSYSPGGRTFGFKNSLYPKRATKIISKTPRRK